MTCFPAGLHSSVNLSPEAQILLHCAQAEHDSDALTRIQTLVGHGIDSDLLRDLASRHAMTQLVYRHLYAACPAYVPTQLRREYHMNVLHNKFLTKETLRLAATLRVHEIAAIPYKGPALASYVYGDISSRQSSDIDILVQAKDVRRVRDILIQHGYQVQQPLRADQEEFWLRNSGEYNFVSPNGVMVEVHWRFVERYLGVQLRYEKIWQRVMKTRLSGQEILTLCPEDLLLALCVHGTKHTWDQFNWICDIAALVRTFPHLNWAGLIREATISGCRRMLFVGLSIADTLIGLDLPQPIRNRIARDGAARILATSVCQRLFVEPKPLINVVLFQIEAKERLRDHLYYYYSLHAQRLAGRRVGLQTTYLTREDWATVPNSLLFLCHHHPPLRKFFSDKVRAKPADSRLVSWFT